MVEFKSDDLLQEIEVYRTSEASDIQTYGTVGASTPLVSYAGASLQNTIKIEGAGGALTDNIAPNKNYYYYFRAVDVHGHKSNPTPIYQVRVLDDEGIAYLDVKMFIPEGVEPEIPTLQNFAAIETTHFLEPKKLKLRLTSKASGKKIDLNFSFKFSKTT